QFFIFEEVFVMIIALYIVVVFSLTDNSLGNNVFFDCCVGVINVFFCDSVFLRFYFMNENG
ncbi:hypothetical protein ACIL5R_004485, partial [Escherichia coli]